MANYTPSADVIEKARALIAAVDDLESLAELGQIGSLIAGMQVIARAEAKLCTAAAARLPELHAMAVSS